MDGLLTVLDFETTSLENPFAIEIGMIALDDNFMEIARYESVIRPPEEVSKKILGLTGLTTNQIKIAPTFEELWPDIHPFLSGRIFVAHSAQFENRVLYKEFLRLGIEEYLPSSICTYQLSKKILNGLPKYTLEYLTGYLNIPHLESHQALGDVVPTAELLRKLCAFDSLALDEIAKRRKSLVTIPKPQDIALNPLARLRSEPESHSTARVIELLKENSKTRISITGTPALGKEELSKKFQRVGLIYQEGPVVNSMAFVVRCDLKPGESKVQKAKEKGIPVISEQVALQIIDELNQK